MTFWQKGKRKPQRSALPVASVTTREDARRVQTHFCRLSYDGKWYIWTNFSGRVEDLEEVSQRIEEYLNGPQTP